MLFLTVRNNFPFQWLFCLNFFQRGHSQFSVDKNSFNVFCHDYVFKKGHSQFSVDFKFIQCFLTTSSMLKVLEITYLDIFLTSVITIYVNRSKMLINEGFESSRHISEGFVHTIFLDSGSEFFCVNLTVLKKVSGTL